MDRNRIIKVLSKEEIEEKYPKENNSNAAILTREIMELGYEIIYLKMDELGKDRFFYMEVKNAIQELLKSDKFEIGCYTDLSELKEDVVYIAVKEI